MADVPSALYNWSTTTGSNSPNNTTTVGTGVAPNFQEIQGVVRRALASIGANIASASTTDIGAVDGRAHLITGTTAITSLGTVASGLEKVLVFQGALTFTHNATSLILPGGANITTAANDVAWVESLGSGNWRCLSYTKASGLPVVSPTVTGPFTDASALVFNSSVSTKQLKVGAAGITTATTRTAYSADEDSNLGIGWTPVNLKVVVSVGVNDVTIAYKDRNGNDFTSSNPLVGRFRSTTTTNGGYDVASIIGAKSLTISNGSTLGTANATAHRIYFGRINNGGTVELWVYNPVSGINHSACLSNSLVSTTAEGGAGAADSAQTFYSSSALSNKAIIIDGYFESTQTTAGTWINAPTVHVLRPGDPISGSIVQRVLNHSSTFTSTTSTIPQDDTLPQNTEGALALTTAVTPKNSANLLRVDSQLTLNWVGTNDSICVALFDGNGTNAVAAALVAAGAAFGFDMAVPMIYTAVANSASTITFTLRYGSGTGITVALNGFNSARKFGGALTGYLNVSEIFA